MDFTLSSEQQEAAELAGRILGDRCTQARLRQVEASGARFDAELWHETGTAGLVGIGLPEEYGGAGLGLLELCSVLAEVGRVVAPLPLAAHGPTAMTIARFGSPRQRDTWLPGAAAGRTVLTSALSEDHASDPARPTTTAELAPDAGAGSTGLWWLTGAKTVVPAGTVADLFVVPADTAAGLTVFLVRPDDAGVAVEAQTLNDGDLAARLVLDSVSLGDDRVLGGAGNGAEVVRWLSQRLTVALCALQVGIVEGALALTAEYARTREQFGRPIGTFQAVSQRLADGYIDAQGARLTLWEAAWRLSEDLPADVEVATAKMWAADAGHRVGHTTVHVHGGVGIDLDGAAHRYFTAATRVEFTLGGTTEQARAIGRILAAEPG
jgi:3-oxocholest-4-en-26-oyl-CoA dehydrogenase beta subunit